VSPAEVARGADENESTYINLEDPSRRFIFSLRSAYPWSPDREGDRGLISGFVEAVLGLGAGYSSVRAVKRTVAGFGGEEAIIHDKERGTLAFTWARDPVRGTGGYSPNLRLDMRAPDEQREAALAVWDAILGSIRPLPPR
jgi:hypothetical protein